MEKLIRFTNDEIGKFGLNFSSKSANLGVAC